MIRVERHGEVTFIRLARRVLGRPFFWGGCYLVDGLLVDCGPPATARELARLVEGERLDGVVITHHHEDHMGAAALLHRMRGIRPRLRDLGVPLLARPFEDMDLYRRLAWGMTEATPADALGPEVHTRSLRFTVVATPGHSIDHVCFFEPERGWLFSGDLFLAERLRYLRSDEDLSALIGSLDAVASLPVREVFCAHRGPVRDGPAALRRKAAHLAALRARVQELLDQGLPEREVARRAVGREGFLTWFSAGAFSAVNFVRAVARHRQPV